MTQTHKGDRNYVRETSVYNTAIGSSGNRYAIDKQFLVKLLNDADQCAELERTRQRLVAERDAAVAAREALELHHRLLMEEHRQLKESLE